MNAHHRNKVRAAIMAIVGVVLVAATAEFYVMRELLAALILFAVLFGAAGTALLIIVAMEESILTGIVHLEARLIRVRAQARER